MSAARFGPRERDRVRRRVAVRQVRVRGRGAVDVIDGMVRLEIGNASRAGIYRGVVLGEGRRARRRRAVEFRVVWVGIDGRRWSSVRLHRKRLRRRWYVGIIVRDDRTPNILRLLRKEDLI